MALQHIPLGQLDETRLRRLIDGRAAEARDIEYKRDMYGTADRDHAEFLADISSFANTAGGDIVIGMAASRGIPTGFAPLTSDPDAEILRLENIARSGVQPRITNLRIKSVPLSGGGHVIVVRIPRSYNPPHRVIRQGTGQNRFYARSSAGKYEPNVDELRLLFTLAPQLADRIRDFRFNRLAKILSDEAPVSLLDRHLLVMHIVPFSGFDRSFSLPLGRHIEWYYTFAPLLSSHPSNFGINVDGLLTLSNAEASAANQRAYVQVFHSGIVEAVSSSFIAGDAPGRLTAIKTEASIVKYSHMYLRALIALGCGPPFALLVSLIGVKGTQYSFTVGRSLFEDEAGTLDRDQFHFTEILIEEVVEDVYAHARLLRPLLDQIANAAGRLFTPTFDESGAFRLRVD